MANNRFFLQNIQRASDTVLVTFNNKLYAIIADYNFIFNESTAWGGYRPNPENWISLTKLSNGLLNATLVTRTQLFNTDMFKQALQAVTNNGLAINYQKVQATTLDHTCFVGGTLVHTKRGLVAIQDIQSGEYVLSADPVTGQQSYQPVSRKHAYLLCW